MTMMGCCVPSRDTSDRFSDRCFNVFPCLSDPVRRSTLCMKLALVMLHIVFVGFLFIFDDELIQKSKQQPWYTSMYMLLVVVTLVQYFFTSGSSPGYVVDAMREYARTEASLRASEISKQPASSKNGSVVVTIDSNQFGEHLLGNNPLNWTKIVMDMYPPGTSVRTYTCSYCNVVQPPRAKHCHDCDRCVLQFDHHCVWLGTCIGQGNHCRFWWYILGETALSIWTGILYIKYLQTHIDAAEEFKKEFGQFDRSGFYRQQRKRKQDKVQHWFWLGLYRVQDIVKVWGQFCHESIMCRFCTWGYFWKVFLDFLWLHFLIKKRWQQHENMGRFGLSRVQHIFSTRGYFWKNWWVLKHIVTWFSVGNFGLLHPEALGVFLIWSCTEVIGAIRLRSYWGVIGFCHAGG